jgi:hypothetical protein
MNALTHDLDLATDMRAYVNGELRDTEAEDVVDATKSGLERYFASGD